MLGSEFALLETVSPAASTTDRSTASPRLFSDELLQPLLQRRERRFATRCGVVGLKDVAPDFGSDADRFLQAGIDLRVDHTEYHMHHKFAVFDDTVQLNGSYNWTRGAAAKNEENFIVTNNRRLVTIFSKTFEELWQQFKA